MNNTDDNTENTNITAISVIVLLLNGFGNHWQDGVQC